MKPLGRTVLAGAAFLALGVGTLAVAAARNSHVLTVRLPDGSIEKIHYTGDVAPTVRLQTGAEPVVFVPAGFAPVALANDPMFARMQQISAAMDRQAAEMMAAFDGAGPGPGFAPQAFAPLMHVDLGALPAGASGYTMVSTMSGSGVCTQSYEYVARPGQAPKVTSHSSSGCKGEGAAAPALTTPETAAPEAVAPAPLGPQHAPGLVQASYPRP